MRRWRAERGEGVVIGHHDGGPVVAWPASASATGLVTIGPIRASLLTRPDLRSDTGPGRESVDLLVADQGSRLLRQHIADYVLAVLMPALRADLGGEGPRGAVVHATEVVDRMAALMPASGGAS